MIRATVLALALASTVVAGPAAAQPKGEPGFGVGGGGGRPLFLEHLYRPELVMRHQGALALTAEQRAAIQAAIQATQGRLGPLQWELDASSEAVAKLVDADKVDVDAALAAAQQAIDLEGQIKREHLSLLLTIKNQLTQAQQAKLRELRPERCGPGGPGGPGGHGGTGGDRLRRPPPPPPGEDGGPPPEP